MNVAAFYAKRAGGTRARVVPLDSDDSCLSDSGDSDEEYLPKPDEETSSSDEDADGLPHAPPSAADARGRAATTQRRRQTVAWKTVKQQNSAKEVPVWPDALPDAEAIRLPIRYFRDFFDRELLDKIVVQSNLYCTQQNPNRALNLDWTELEQFLGTVVYMSIFLLPRSRMHWSSASQVQHMAEVMSRDRWEEIKHYIHFCDNMASDNDDRLFKIRLIID